MAFTVTYTFSAGTTIVAAHTNQNNDDIESELDSKPANLTDLGVTASAAELNILDGATLDVNELNILDGATLSVTELNYVDGVTSAIQTQLDGKQATVTGGASTITSSNLTASRALASNASGKVEVSAATSTELGYLSGVTSAIQTQINAISGGTPTYTSGWITMASINASCTQAHSLGAVPDMVLGIVKVTNPGSLGASTIYQIVTHGFGYGGGGIEISFDETNCYACREAGTVYVPNTTANTAVSDSTVIYIKFYCWVY